MNEAFLFGEKTSGVGWWHMAFGRVVAAKLTVDTEALAQMLSDELKDAEEKPEEAAASDK